MERKREKQATGEAIGAATGAKTPPPAGNTLKEPTLLQLFEEAMKEKPREIEDALKKLPRSTQLGKTNKNYSRMDSLQARLALKQETLEAIERRDARLNEPRLLYSQVVNARRPVSLSTEQLHQAPAQPTSFNGFTNSTKPMEHRKAQDIDEGWTMVTRRKPRGF